MKAPLPSPDLLGYAETPGVTVRHVRWIGVVVLVSVASLGSCGGSGGDPDPVLRSAAYSQCALGEGEDRDPPFLYWAMGAIAVFSTDDRVAERVAPRGDSAAERDAARLENERNAEAAFVLHPDQVRAVRDLGEDAVSIFAYTAWGGPARLTELLVFLMPDDSVVFAGVCASEYAVALEAFAASEGLTAGTVMRTIVAEPELGVAVSPYQSGIDFPDFEPIEG